jgi:hypothetical protein
MFWLFGLYVFLNTGSFEEVNAEQTNRISYYQNAAQNCRLKTANRFIENMTGFSCLGTAARYQIWGHEEIKITFSLGIACCLSVQDILSCLKT